MLVALPLQETAARSTASTEFFSRTYPNTYLGNTGHFGPFWAIFFLILSILGISGHFWQFWANLGILGISEHILKESFIWDALYLPGKPTPQITSFD